MTAVEHVSLTVQRDMQNPCATGCRIAGAHTTTCSADGCRGCQPRPATEGTLCDWCYQQLTRAVADIPDIVAHLKFVALGAQAAHVAPPTDDIQHGNDPAESTVLHAATLDADELESFLDSWAHVVIEEHPSQPMRGPSAGPWHGDVTAWITPHLRWIAAQDWAFEMRRDLCDTIATIRHKHPSADDVEPIKQLDMPCPRCGLISLIYTPPRYATQAFRVECTDPDCARVFSEDEWDRFKALALDARHGKVAA